MKKDQIPDLLFSTANGFYELSLNIAKSLRKAEGRVSFQRLSPAAVNICLTVELYIKGLLLLTTKNHPNTHSLKILFQQLPLKLRFAIEARYMDYQIKAKSENELPAYKMIISNEENSDPPEDDPEIITIKDLLETHNKGFEDWRYTHEITNGGYTLVINFKLINCLIKALQDIITIEKKYHPKKSSF